MGIICDRCGRELVNRGCFTQHYTKCLLTPLWIIQLNNDFKLYAKFLNKKNNSYKEGIYFDLTYKQWCELLKEACIKSSDLGFSGNNYVLARFGDKGGYTWGNCRFITQKQNILEKEITDKQREVARKQAEKMTELNRNTPKEIVSERIKRGKALASSVQSKREKQNKIIAPNPKTINYQGEKNSQWGTFWITNGVDNKKWGSQKGEIPKGYYKGRRCK